MFRREAPSLNLKTYEAGLVQAQAYRALSNFMTTSLESHAIALPEWALMGLLYEYKRLRPTQISDLLAVKPPVATTLLRSLEEKKILTRQGDPNDSRVTLVELTLHGHQNVVQIEKQLRKELREFMKDISVRELITYIRVLQKLAAKA